MLFIQVSFQLISCKITYKFEFTLLLEKKFSPHTAGGFWLSKVYTLLQKKVHTNFKGEKMYLAPNFPEGCRLLVYIFWRIKFLDLCFVQNSLAKWIYFYFLWGKSFFSWRNLNSSLICQAEDCLHNSRLIQYGFLIFDLYFYYFTDFQISIMGLDAKWCGSIERHIGWQCHFIIIPSNI